MAPSTIHRLPLLLAVLFPLCALAQPAFPGAEGFGAGASGGRGGKVIYVTNLNVSGPGSLADALAQEGPRYILFKVSGVIPGTVSVPPGRHDLTLAGQTSPGGITVRGLEMYNGSEPTVSNVIIRHIRSRIGDTQKFPTPNWLGSDGLTLGGVHNAIIDHCSFAHASDEAVDISRSSRISIQHCILAETLGPHAYLGGMLINYSDATSRLDSLSIHHNTWDRIGGRMPEISCETPYCNGQTLRIELSNNLFWDPQIELWYEGMTGFNGSYFLQMNAVGNLSVARPSYSNGMFHHDLLHFPQNQLHFSGNRLNLYPGLQDYDLFYCCNDFPDGKPNTDLGQAQLSPTAFAFPPITYHSTAALPGVIAARAGAFPRDAMDTRLMGYIQSATLPSLPVDQAAAEDAFTLNPPGSSPSDGDADGMPDYWEAGHGLDPNMQDHNGTSLSVPVTGIAGYTNLECYLNCLSDALVNGYTTPACGIAGYTTLVEDPDGAGRAMRIFPNPVTSGLVTVETDLERAELLLFDPLGRTLAQVSLPSGSGTIDIGRLPPGVYTLQLLRAGVLLRAQRLVVTGR